MTHTDIREKATFERIVEELRRPADLDPWLDARIMHAVREARPLPWWERARAWFRDPVAFRVSPRTLIAAAAAVAALTVGLVRSEKGTTGSGPVAISGTSAATLPAANRPGSRSVQFVVVLPNAKAVALVGDFNDWQARATPLRRVGDGGMWTVEVTLPPGHHEYAFIVDGSVWMADPNAPLTVDDDFGKPNSVIVVEGSA